MSIQQSWVDFEKKIIPEGASEEQRRDMKMAYLGGVYVALTAMDTIVDVEPDENKAALMVGALYTECTQLINEITGSKNDSH